MSIPVSSNGVTYKIDSSVSSYSGVGNAFVTISWGSKKAMLYWDNVDTKAGREGLKNFLTALAELNADVWTDFVRAWPKVIGTKTNEKVVAYAEKIMRAICSKFDTDADSLISDLSKQLGKDFKSDLLKIVGSGGAKKLLKGFLEDFFPNGKKIINSISPFITLEETVTVFTSKVDKFKNMAEKALGKEGSVKSEYELLKSFSENEFKTAYDSLQQSITTDNYSGPTILDKIINVAADFFGSLKLGASSEYSAVKSIDATKNKNNIILAGNTNNNSIVGGSGKNSLWGGKGGNNTLTGGSSRDQYWFSGDGNDVVTNFKSGTSSTADVLVFYGTGFKNITRTDKNIIVTGSTGKQITLQSNSGSDTTFLYAKNGKGIAGAKVGTSSDKTLTYDSAVKYYKLNGKGTLNVTGAGNNDVRLTGAGVTYSGITNIDASDATGNNILVGSSKSANSIVGGRGKNSLWGGKGNYSDTLIGGNGKDVFWWTKNSGSDEVENASQDDTIKLMSIKVKDLSRKKVYDDSIVLTLKNGNSLIIENSSDVTPTFNFAGGKNYVYNRTTNKWSKT